MVTPRWLKSKGHSWQELVCSCFLCVVCECEVCVWVVCEYEVCEVCGVGGM